MKPKCRERVEGRESKVESRAARSAVDSVVRHSSPVTRHFRRAFTLIELLTVIAIIGILAALLAPSLKGLLKPDASVAASRQLLDDFARARQLAISQRSTVYMVFIPTNFWTSTAWTALPTAVQTSMVATQAYGAQLNGYMMVSLRDVGDQPGRGIPKDLAGIKTLPSGSFFAPFIYAPLAAPIFPFNRPDLPIYGLPLTNNIPFPTAAVLTNAGPPNPNYLSTFQSSGGLSLPYIAFNYLGQLTAGDGSVLPYDQNIPIDYGSFGPALSPGSKLPMQANPSYTEEPPGNATNISYNIIHVDRLTGRARLERQDAL